MSLALPELAPLADLPPLLGLVTARLLPLVVVAPVFGGPAVPRRVRLGMAIALAVGLTAAMGTPPAPPLDAATYVGLLVKEVLVGLVLALLVLLLFETFGAAGIVVDAVRGASFAMIADPLSRQRTSPVGVLYVQASIVLFLTLGGYGLVLRALVDTYELVPPYAAVPPALADGTMAVMLIDASARLIADAVRLAAPVLLVTLLLDVGLGLVNRAAPQIQAFFLGMTVKGWLGILVVLLGLPLVLGEQLPRHVAQVIDLLTGWLP